MCTLSDSLTTRLDLIAILCTFQISVDFYYVPVSGRGGGRGEAGEWEGARESTVKRVDKVVRHPHLVTQDQNTQVSNKFFDIPVENFTINIELFRHFSQVSN